MPRTVQEITSEALLNVASDAGQNTAANFLNQRYRRLASKVRFRHLRKRVEIVLPGLVSEGEATFTQNSDLVTGDADALVAWQALGAAKLRGRFIRAGSGGSQPWLEIAGLELDGLRLTAAFPFTTLAEGSYSIVARYHRLVGNIRWLGAVSVPRLNQPLTLGSEAEGNEYWAGRVVTGSGHPFKFWLAPPDFDGAPRIEVYPPAQSAESLHYVCHLEPPFLALTDYLPFGLSEDVLREGMEVNLLRLKWAKAVEEKQYDGAAHYRNEYNSSLTRWERDAYAMAGDVDTTVGDDFIMVRGPESMVERNWERALEEGLWPDGL